MKTFLLSRLRVARDDQSGITAIEYGLIAAVMATLIGAVFVLLKDPMTTLFDNIGVLLLKT